MIQRVSNAVTITCEAVDFTEATDLRVWLEQGYERFEYALSPIDAHTASFAMPKADAMRLDPTALRIQFALTDPSGTPVVSEIRTIPVSELLKEAGYGD